MTICFLFIIKLIKKFHQSCPHAGSNYGPSVYKTDALPLSYKGRDVDPLLLFFIIYYLLLDHHTLPAVLLCRLISTKTPETSFPDSPLSIRLVVGFAAFPRCLLQTPMPFFAWCREEVFVLSCPFPQLSYTHFLPPIDFFDHPSSR